MDPARVDVVLRAVVGTRVDYLRAAVYTSGMKFERCAHLG